MLLILTELVSENNLKVGIIHFHSIITTIGICMSCLLRNFFSTAQYQFIFHQLIEFLEEQAISIQKRVKEATGINIMKPVYYSAEYGWNVQKVFDFIIDHMPLQRRPLIK